jgi:hypothetical protein
MEAEEADVWQSRLLLPTVVTAFWKEQRTKMRLPERSYCFEPLCYYQFLTPSLNNQ